MTDLSTWPPGTYIGNPNYNVNGQLYTWTSDYDAATSAPRPDYCHRQR